MHAVHGGRLGMQTQTGLQLPGHGSNLPVKYRTLMLDWHSLKKAFILELSQPLHRGLGNYFWTLHNP